MEGKHLVLSITSGFVVGVLLYQVTKRVIISREANDDIDTKEESY